MHTSDVASLFRLALEKGPAGKFWHALEDDGISFREIAEAIGSRVGVPAVSIPIVDGKIAEATIWWRSLPAGVELQRVLAKVLGMQPWELRTDGE